MRFDFTLGRPEDAPLRPRRPVRRVLVLGDLLGNGALANDRVLDRKIITVDVDTLDDALARVAPAIDLGPAAGGEHLEIRRFDDFHPDALVESLSVFRRLHDIRTRLQHPGTFAGAATELRAEATAPAPATIAAATGGPASIADGEASVLARLLGRAGTESSDEAAPARGSDHLAGTVDALIRQAVAPHIVPSPHPQLPQMLSAVDAGMTDLMRAVLHDPAFQQVEAVWRGVQWLVSTLDLGDTLELHLMHVTRDELPQAAQDGDLWRRLIERDRGPGRAPEFSVLVGNFQFGPLADDIAALEQLGTLAAALGAPFVAAASPSLVGAINLASQPDPREWTPLDGAAEARWQALRGRAAAAHIGLALPRLLLRLPYGQRSDPIAAFTFQEQTTPPEHESFLWGSSALAYAVVLTRLLDDEGDPSTAGAIGALPAFVYTTDEGAALQPPAEIALSERAVEAIQARGLMPVIASVNRDDIRLLTPQAMAIRPSRLA